MLFSDIAPNFKSDFVKKMNDNKILKLEIKFGKKKIEWNELINFDLKMQSFFPLKLLFDRISVEFNEKSLNFEIYPKRKRVQNSTFLETDYLGKEEICFCKFIKPFYKETVLKCEKISILAKNFIFEFDFFGENG
ncbi:hypothetical protein MHBO_000801 [Bonamia ostreae]|uniref:Uncharacterized protein n=1 Tax=Bonamia ostreae TaxID=126728 RepID=A0ABV2AGV6_9EUKA